MPLASVRFPIVFLPQVSLASLHDLVRYTSHLRTDLPRDPRASRDVFSASLRQAHADMLRQDHNGRTQCGASVSTGDTNQSRASAGSCLCFFLVKTPSQRNKKDVQQSKSRTLKLAPFEKAEDEREPLLVVLSYHRLRVIDTVEPVYH